jgi:(E)-4-hydroxy-3-methylbut-2-enyl-diphosphate synthase
MLSPINPFLEKNVRRRTVEVMVGAVGIGGDNPIRIQSMTNTPTSDIDVTVRQIIELREAGSELVRFTVKDDADARAVPYIRDKLRLEGCDVPIIGDFHYNGQRLLTAYPECARALDKLRINPGNVGFGDHRDLNFETFIQQAITYDKPVRIGVNFGSMDKRVFNKLLEENAGKPDGEKKTHEEISVDAMVASAVESVKMAERIGLPHHKIVLSVKVSRVVEMIEANRLLSRQSDLPLHLGVTEAGMGVKGAVASTAGLSVLLHEGIGDTIRTSLTPSLRSSRTEEVLVCQQILQFLGMRNFLPTVTSCPGCGRTRSTAFQEIAEEITAYLMERTPVWRKKGYKGFEGMVVAVMGCVVNGPGESREADIGISLPGTGEDTDAVVFVDGARVGTLSGPHRIAEFKKMVEEYAAAACTGSRRFH